MKYGPEDFASETPPPRVIGTEMEYHVQHGWGVKGGIYEGLGRLGIESVGQYCSNGARVYPEFDIEYATPESLGPRRAAAADFAGMAIIDQLFQPVVSEVEPFPILRHSGSYSIKEGSTESRGYHENYLTPLPETDAEQGLLKAVLGGFLATRIIWNGVGLLTHEGYLLSQKAPGIGAPVVDGYGNRTTHGQKPLAGFLQSNGSAHDKISPDWALLEVRSADAHMSRAQTYASLAVTSLALRLVEQKAINFSNWGDFVLKFPVSSLHRINKKHGRGQLELASGKSTTALKLQKAYAEEILKMAEKTTLPVDELVAAKWFYNVCEKLEKSGRAESLEELKPLIKDVEWAAKLYFMKQKCGQTKGKKKLEKQAAFDLEWHRIDDQSIGLKVYDKLDAWRAKKADEGSDTAGTRASARAKAIASGACTGAGWNFVEVNGRKIYLDDYWSEELPVSQPAEAVA